MKNLLILFGAGCLGGLAQSLVTWLAGYYGLTAQYNVLIAPNLTPEWIYPKIVWGGIWGMLFLLPMAANRPLLTGITLSVFPTIAQLFIIYPYVDNVGVAGMGLGQLTPLFIAVFNLVWGIVTAFAIRASK